MQIKGPTVECVLCHRKFTFDDILTYRYFIEAGVCYECYSKMKSRPASITCFGKSETKTKPGYNATSKECKHLCPDRKVCPLFVTGELEDKIQELDPVARKGAIELLKPKDARLRSRKHPFRQGTVTYDAFELCRKGIKRKKFSRWCKRQGCSESRLLRMFRSESIYGKSWMWSEEDHKFKIVFPA